MSRWFRHYAGMMRDEKLVSAALRSKQPVERVVWVWGAILESAAEINDEGRYEIDHGEIAYFLRADEGDIRGIETALGVLGRVCENRVGKWGERQFLSDNSAERQRRYRKRHSDNNGTEENVTVTSPSRPSDAPETELDTNTEKKEKRLSGARAPRRSPDDFEKFWKDYPKTPVMSKKQALAEWEKLSPEAQSAASSTVEAFKDWLKKQKDHPVVHACRFLSQRRFEGFAAEKSTGPQKRFIRQDSPEFAEAMRREGKTKVPIVNEGWWFDPLPDSEQKSEAA